MTPRLLACSSPSFGHLSRRWQFDARLFQLLLVRMPGTSTTQTPRQTPRQTPSTSENLPHLFSRSSEDFQRRQLQVSSLQNWPSRAKGTKRHQEKLTAESAKAPLQRCQPSKHQRCPRKSQQNAGYGWPGWLRRYGAVVFKEQPATAEHGKTMQNFRWSLLMSRKTTATLLVSNEATSMAVVSPVMWCSPRCCFASNNLRPTHECPQLGQHFHQATSGAQIQQEHDTPLEARHLGLLMPDHMSESCLHVLAKADVALVANTARTSNTH